MARKERLPKYVSCFIDSRGKRRYRYRRAGCSRYLEHHPNSVTGKAEYEGFLSGSAPAKAERRKFVAGSIDDLLSRYYTSTAFRGRAVEVTLAKRRAVLESFRAKHGHRLVSDARYDKLDKYIAEVAVPTPDDKGRIHGGQFAAETARKLLRSLFRYAVKLQWRGDNPMDYVEFRPKQSVGFHSWSEAEISQYRDCYALGTKQRLALELMLWTGKRRSDAVTLGPQHVVNGELIGRDQKTNKLYVLPIAPQLRHAIDAMGENNHLCFLVSDRGRAYSAASFGNQFRRWCDDAGLPHCSAHGLRKAISRRLAEDGQGNAGIKSVTLHSRDDEVAKYVAGADQKRLAKGAIGRISARELSNARRDARQSASGKTIK